MNNDIQAYNKKQSKADQLICNKLAKEIDSVLTEAEKKIWHAHPVWFLEGNPIVGYSKLKDCVRLLFWSGQSFDEPGLSKEGSFKAAEDPLHGSGSDQFERSETMVGKIQDDTMGL